MHSPPSHTGSPDIGLTMPSAYHTRNNDGSNGLVDGVAHRRQTPPNTSPMTNIRSGLSSDRLKQSSFGMLNAGTDLLSRSNSQLLGRGVLYLCLMQVLCGTAVFYSSARYLYSFSTTTGEVLGGLLCSVSLIGVLGSFRKNRSLLNVYLVGTLLVMILCFHFMSEVQREVNTDCSMAELDLRLKVMEGIAERNTQTTMFTALVSRLDEMDEMMSMVEEKTTKIALTSGNDVAQNQANFDKKIDELETIRLDDYDFIKGKLTTLAQHAQQLLDVDMMSKESESGQKLDQIISQEERDRLQNKIEAAQAVLDNIPNVDKKDYHDMTVEDYKDLIQALTQATVEINAVTRKHKLNNPTISPKPLYKELGDAKKVKEALDRQEFLEDEFSRQVEMYEDGHTKVYDSPDQMRRKRDLDIRRKEFRKQFEKQLVDNFYSTMGMNVDDLPEHCINESTARDILSYAAVGLLGLQLTSAYLVLSLLFRIPVKAD